MKTAKQILNKKYDEVGAWNMHDGHRIEAMEEYARERSKYKYRGFFLLIYFMLFIPTCLSLFDIVEYYETGFTVYISNNINNIFVAFVVFIPSISLWAIGLTSVILNDQVFDLKK